MSDLPDKETNKSILKTNPDYINRISLTPKDLALSSFQKCSKTLNPLKDEVLMAFVWRL
ncbi:MAG: hypothetical protein ACW98A_13060 [Candidatus Hodarchaeales archaeon]|jgi:hypothetical protein